MKIYNIVAENTVTGEKKILEQTKSVAHMRYLKKKYREEYGSNWIITNTVTIIT